VTVLVPVIAPYASSRRHAERGLRYVEVHVAAPLTVCRSRDVKGLYAKHDRGAISGLTGVDDPYEEPESPDLVLRTAGEPVSGSVDRLYALLASGE
jgi:adenylylsulfate kinase